MTEKEIREIIREEITLAIRENLCIEADYFSRYGGEESGIEVKLLWYDKEISSTMAYD